MAFVMTASSFLVDTTVTRWTIAAVHHGAVVVPFALCFSGTRFGEFASSG